MGGPLEGRSDLLAERPPSIEVIGGRYVPWVRCADDGSLRYVFAPARDD